MILFHGSNIEIFDIDFTKCKPCLLYTSPERFYYYNNGIKLLCKSIKRKAKDSTTNATGLFALEGVSLVNGAQTTGTIGSLFFDNPRCV